MASKKRKAPRGRSLSLALSENQPDRRVALGVALAAAAIFFSTYSPQVELGDSGESVAGAEALGILHAPGYPLYVLAARLFSVVVPVGTLAARVNLFSLVCATGAVTLTFLLAQRFGASRVGAAAGALTLATGTSFWFYAGYAKHYAFSALLVVAAAYLVTRWIVRPALWRLVAAGAVVGLLAGAAWQFSVLLVPSLVALLWLGRRPGKREIASAAATVVVVAVAIGAYTMFRASQQPVLNWGGASNLARLSDLVTMEDFGFGWNTFGGEDEPLQKGVNDRDVADFPARTARYLVLLSREWSVLAVAVAAIGVAAARRIRVVFAFLLVAIVLNMIGAGLVIGLRQLPNVNTVLAQGGFLSGLFIVLAVAVAFGVDAIASAFARARWAKPRGWVGPAGGVALAAALIAPALITHYRSANHRIPPYAEQYAENVFATLPADAVLFVWGAERAFPLVHAQVVEGVRPDVLLVYADALHRPWYQEQLARELDIDVRPAGDRADVAADAVRQSEEIRPTFVDMRAMTVLRREMRYRLHGLIAAPVDDAPDVALSPADLRELEEVIAGYAVDGVYHDGYRRRFPNGRVLLAYATMHQEMASHYLRARNNDALQHHIALSNEVLGQEAGTHSHNRPR